MLVGQYKSKLTDKDRIAVPKKVREDLGNDLIVAKWYEGCLVLVSRQGWERLLERVLGKSELVIAPVRDIDRFILGSAFEIVLDNQGRFIIPEVLLAYAQIKDEVAFIGLGDRVEIWPLSKWSQIEESAEAKASAAIEKIAEEQKNVSNQKLQRKQK